MYIFWLVSNATNFNGDFSEPDRTSRGQVAVGVGGDVMLISLGSSGSIQSDQGGVPAAQAAKSR